MHLCLRLPSVAEAAIRAALRLGSRLCSLDRFQLMRKSVGRLTNLFPSSVIVSLAWPM
jgi:hypothetical protein